MGWFGRAAIYALPARYEPFGLSVLEAALSGCALVLGDIASLREVWGEAALYVRPDDAQALAETINHLAADEQLRTYLAEAARSRAEQYTLSAMGVGYWQAYQSLRAEAVVPAPLTGRPSPLFWQVAATYQPSTQLGR